MDNATILNHTYTHGHFKILLRDDGILLVGFDYEGRTVNVLDKKSLEKLAHIVRNEFLNNSFARAMILLSLKQGNFIAGADIEQFMKLRTPADYSALEGLITDTDIELHRMEHSPKPIIAAIEGSCMGGGLEIALACHARVASTHEKTVLALPEVKLGIIPGFGGTQRLPRLIGLPSALLMITTGKSIYPRGALKMGLIDDCVDSVPSDERTLEAVSKERLIQAAIQRARSMMQSGMCRKRSFAASFSLTPLARRAMALRARQSVEKETKGWYPAPVSAITAIKEGMGKSVLRASLDIERGTFMELVCSRTSKNLVGIYCGGEELKRKAKQRAVGKCPSRVGVIGAGLMGWQIAHILVSKGFEVVLKDVADEPLAKAIERIACEQSALLKKRAITQSEYNRRMMRVYPTTQNDDLKSVPFVIEAATENLAIKRNILSDVPPDCVFATNTSSLVVKEIADGQGNAERCVGLHFFNPVQKMPLVEVIRPAGASEGAFGAACAVAGALGKYPVIVSDTPGFLVNRILARYLAEAVLLVEDGFSIATIDRVAKQFGMPMGPLELIDVVGFSVAAEVLKTLRCFAPRVPSPRLIAEMEKLKEPKFWVRKGVENKDILFFIKETGWSKPDTDPTEAHLLERMFLPMVDEAFRCLHEGVVATREELDCAMVFGAGFPPFRGGLMKWALDEYKSEARIGWRLLALEMAYGERFKPF